MALPSLKGVGLFNPSEQTMEFRVGEGLTEGQTKSALGVIKRDPPQKFKQPVLERFPIAPKEFIGDPKSTKDLVVNTVIGLPEATLKTLPFTRLLAEPTPARFEDRLQAIGNEAGEFVKGLGVMLAQVPISAVSLLRDEPIEEQVKRVPLLGDVPTFERQAHDMLLMGVSPLEVGITLGSQAAITAGILAPFLAKGIRVAEPIITQKTIKTTLSRQDVIDITRGAKVAPEKVNAFKESVQQGISLGQQLRKNAKPITIRVKTPNATGELLYEPIGKNTFRRVVQDIKVSGVPEGFEPVGDAFPVGLSAKPVRPKIPKELEPLAQEARRFDGFISTKNLETLKHRGGFRTPEQIAKLEKGISKEGIKEPVKIIIKQNKDIVIDDGIHRLQIAEKLGIERVPVEFFNIPKGAGATKLSKQETIDFFNQVKGVAGEKLPGVPGVTGLKKVGLAPEKAVSPSARLKETELTKKGIVAKPEKALLIARIRDRVKQGKEISKAESNALGLGIQAERQAIREGRELVRAERIRVTNKFRAEIKDVKAIKNEITQNVIKRSGFSEVKLKSAIKMVRDAKTQKDLTKAYSRIVRWAEEVESRGLDRDIIETSKKALDSFNVSADLKTRISDLLKDYDFKKLSDKKEKQLMATEQFIENKLSKGEEVTIPLRITKALRRLNQRPLQQVPIKVKEAILAEIERLTRLGKTKWKTKQELYELEQIDIAEQLIDVARPLQSRDILRPRPGENLTPDAKIRNYINEQMNRFNRIDKALLPIDVLMDMLDGVTGTYDGPHSKLAKGWLDSNFNEYFDLKDKLRKPIIEASKRLGISDTRARRIGVVAARQQGINLERITWKDFTPEQAKAIKLNKEEIEWLEIIRKLQDDTMFPLARQVSLDLFNKEVKKVKDYFRWATDWEFMEQTNVTDRLGPGVEEYSLPTKRTKLGFTEKRLEKAESKVRIDALNVALRHADEVAYAATMGRPVKMLFEIFNSSEYRSAAGDMGQLLMTEFMDTMARKGGAAGSSQIAAIDWLRKNVGAGILGLKLSSAMIQPSAWFDGVGMLGPEFSAKGLAEFANSKEWRQFVLKFPEIRERVGGETAIQELEEATFLRDIQRKGFIPLVFFDQMTAGSIALGAYFRKMSELGLEISPLETPNPEALAYAQLVVRRTQSTSLFKDVPMAISRGAITGNRSIDRALLQFQNFLLARWSRIRYDAIQVGIETKDPKQAANVLFWIAVAMMTATGIRLGVHRIEDFITGRDRDDELSEEAIRGMVYEITGSVPLLGNLYGMYVFGGEPIPIFQAPSDAVEGFSRTLNSKSTPAKMRGLNQFIFSLGELRGIPGSFQAQSLIRQLIPDGSKTKAPTGLPSLRTESGLRGSPLPILKGVGLPK